MKESDDGGLLESFFLRWIGLRADGIHEDRSPLGSGLCDFFCLASPGCVFVPEDKSMVNEQEDDFTR